MKGMAHCKKFTKAACGHMFAHYERKKDENGEYIKFGNQEIDISQSHLNYNLAPERIDGQGNFVKERCSEVKLQNRADVNVMCSWVVTLPKEIDEDEREKFFKETYKFLSERYGKENVVSAYVHMDETTPHIHFAFVPVVMDKKKNILKVSAKEAIDKKELSIFHQNLSAYMEKIFGRDVGLINDATKDGNKTKTELKRDEVQAELEEIEQKTAELTKQSEIKAQEVLESTERINTLKKEEKGLHAKIGALETTFKGKQLTAADLKKIKPEKSLTGIKNITLEDIENLKKTAMGNATTEISLKNLSQEVNRLQKENKELKNKIPKASDMLEYNSRLVKINALEKENARLGNILNKIIAGINQLPEQAREFIKNIINPPTENQRKRSRDDFER